MSGSTPSTTASGPANRAGLRDGEVSEFTVIVPLKEGGGVRLRAIFAGQGGKFAFTSKVGSVHDMRFVFLDNDTKLLFASTYDGDWDSYINDFATLIPDALDVVFKEVDGWQGGLPPSNRLHLLDSRRIAAVSETAVKTAFLSGPSVIVGRGSQFFLRNRKDVFHVFLYASRD